MESPNKQKSSSFTSNLYFLYILLSSNLITLLLSSIYYSSSSCHLNPISITTTNQLFPQEFLTFTSNHTLPLGYSHNFHSSHLNTPVGSLCTHFPHLLHQYMTYPINGSCPDDELLAQNLLLKGCEPLPRRRCRAAAQNDAVEPYPLNISLWTTPDDTSVVWTAYKCKSYECLIERAKRGGVDDCNDCFYLQGRESTRWLDKKGNNNNKLDFGIDEVLSVKPQGSVRIGLDIGGGVATFAVRMRERNVTIVTTSMNFNGPFNNFIAARGLVPLYLSISQRLPFFDNTLDIVHSMHVLSNWIPTTVLHFLLYDIYRVMRPGGLFWLDHFFCLRQQLEETYAPLIESVGFKKIKWEVGRKLDKPDREEMYLSALLEKPLKNSW